MPEYLEIILPICYGELQMTGTDIANAMPWEIAMRMDGYGRRMRNLRILLASFISVPVINSGMRAPKRPVTAKKLLPDDFRTGISMEQKERLVDLMNEAERRE